MSFLRGLLSSPAEEDKQQGGFETIERLCDRLETATLLDDRRDAIRALRALSKSFQVEVGTHAMDMLINVIKEDYTDIEITEMVIETLLNVMASKGEDQPPETDLGVQFTEMFIKSDDNVSLLLSLLEEYEFHVRWPTVRLLILLLKNRSKELQERVLESPMGISKLMDLLVDSREIIRNDGLLLMIKLTKNNPAIQKIVAFENAFERLLHIVSVEGNSDGGIIVEDCLSLLLNLLKNNLSNQNFFRETSNIQRITPYFDMEESEEDGRVVSGPPSWSIQKQNNILLMLDILQVLISPTNNAQSVTLCQKTMYTRGTYMRLMDMLLHPHLPTEIFSKLLLTVGDMIRGNEIIQQFMGELEMSERPAILVILMFMVNDKQPFKTRIAALYCIQCFLYKNGKGQAAIVSTLLPNQEDVQSGVTSGQLLCAGMFSSDPVAHWLCSVTLSHCLYNNVDQHENMLLVQLELTVGEPPVHLINQVFNMLVNESNNRTRFGTLMLLLHWVEDTPGAVATLLNNPACVPQLLELVEHGDVEDVSVTLMSNLSAMLLGMCLKYNDNTCQQYSKSALSHLITHRVGKDNFVELLESASLKPLFTQASKTPHPTATTVNELALDFSFTKFYKKQIDLVTRVLDGEEEGEIEKGLIDSHDEIVAGYKELIKQQDDEINDLKLALGNSSHVGAYTANSDVTSCHDNTNDVTRQTDVLKEQVSQMQEYAKSQEEYYQQYIVQLQSWYSEQMTQLQASHPIDTQQHENTASQCVDNEGVTPPSNQMTSPSNQMTSPSNQMTALDDDAVTRDDTLSSYKGRCENLEIQIREQESTISHLNITLTELEIKLQTLLQQKQQQEQYTAQLVAEVESLRITLSDVGSTSSQENVIIEQEKKLDDLAQEKIHQEKFIENLSVEIDNLKALLKDTQDSSLDKEEKHSPKSSEFQSLIDQQTIHITDLGTQLSSATLSQSRAESECSLLRQKVGEHESECSLLRQEVSEHETECSLLRQEVSEHEIECSLLRQEVSEHEIECNLLRQKVAEAEVNITGLLDQISELKQESKQEIEVSKGNVTEKEEFGENEKDLIVEDNTATSQEEAPQASQDTLQASQDSPEAPQDSPEAPQDSPEAPQDTPQAPQDTLQASQDTLQASQDVSQGTKYLYDYSAWFQNIVADDGLTYYQSRDGHIYTEEQYLYTLEQYDAYYRALQQQNAEQQPSEQQPSEEQPSEEQPTEQQPSEQQPSEEQPSEQQPSEQQPSEQQHYKEVESGLETVSSRKSSNPLPKSDEEDTATIKHGNDGQHEDVLQTYHNKENVKEVTRLRDLVKTYETDVLNLNQQLEQMRTIKDRLSVSTTTHEDIASVNKVLGRSDVSHTVVVGQPLETRSSTPDRATESEIAAIQEKYDNLSLEQEDLLVLLAHQDKKLGQLKERLRTLGDDSNLSESDDDFDDLMDSCEDLPETSELTGDGRLM